MTRRSYWERKVTRRRALAGMAIASGGVIALAAGCGSDAPSDSSGLLSQPQDTSRGAAKGGIYQSYTTVDAPSFDPIGSNASPAITNGMYSYSRIVKYKTGKYPQRADGSVEADAAISWELSGDGLQYTFKLRPNMKLDARPPTRGRALNADDVLFSWNRFASLNSERSVLARSASPEAPIEKVETPDSQTVVMRLAFPYSPLLQMLGYRRYMPIMPTESDGGFDFRNEMRGSGAWLLTKHEPSVGFTYRRNPDWYDADKVYLDGIDMPIVSEYATGLAQFKAGNIWTFGVRAEDMLATKRDVPDLELRADDAFSRATGIYTSFGIQPGSPFIDERVRRAVSMLVDRDLFIETFYNVEPFADAGLAVQTRWNSHLAVGEEGYWLDPKGRDLGDGARFFKYDPAEAKKLLAAAGHTGPIQTQYNFPQNAPYGSNFIPMAEVLRGMWQDQGDFQVRLNPLDYRTSFLPNYHEGNGKFEGMTQGLISARPDVDGFVYSFTRSGSSKAWWGGDPDAKLDSLIDSQRREFDRDRRAGHLREYQKLLATKFYFMIAPGQALGFNLGWPWVGNRGVFPAFDGGGGDPQESLVTLWYDASKRKA
jgi:ABC-type transport system substrate-binding protein